jgi:hypothetical protein
MHRPDGAGRQAHRRRCQSLREERDIARERERVREREIDREREREEIRILFGGK